MPVEMISHLTGAQLEWWTKGRTLEDVRRVVQHSDIIVVFCETDTKRLVAFSVPSSLDLFLFCACFFSLAFTKLS